MSVIKRFQTGHLAAIICKCDIIVLLGQIGCDNDLWKLAWDYTMVLSKLADNMESLFTNVRGMRITY